MLASGSSRRGGGSGGFHLGFQAIQLPLHGDLVHFSLVIGLDLLKLHHIAQSVFRSLNLVLGALLESGFQLHRLDLLLQSCDGAFVLQLFDPGEQFSIRGRRISYDNLLLLRRLFLWSYRLLGFVQEFRKFLLRPISSTGEV
jgi:hypothetical protein